MATIIDPPNSVWPNGLKVDSEGYATFYPLGTNKVDITAITWPDGDKLISPFVYQNDELVGFIDTEALTTADDATIEIPYTHVDADFASIEEGKLIVNAPNAVVKKIKWGTEPVEEEVKKDFPDFSFSDEGGGLFEYEMYYHKQKVSAIRYATEIIDNYIYDESGKKRAKFDTSKIIKGVYTPRAQPPTGLFNLDRTSWNSPTFYLIDTFCLKKFESDLPNLTIGSAMFRNSYISSFKSDLHSLSEGDYMFAGCTELIHFDANLSSLTKASGMFNQTKLNSASILKILNSIKTHTGSSLPITIGIGCSHDDDADKLLFAQETGYESIDALVAAFAAKGWSLTLTYSGRP